MLEVVDLAADTPLVLSVGATAAGALQGALIASTDDDLDHVGMTVMAVCLGFGGGIIRDVLLGTFPPTALTDPWYLGVVLAAVVLVSLLGHLLRRIDPVLLVADAATLGLFAIIATQQALDVDVPLLAACFVGALASVGGGVVADVLRGERPLVMRPGPPYALVGVAGAASYGLLVDVAQVSSEVAALIAIVVTLAGRVITFRLGVRTRAARVEPDPSQ